MSQRASTVSSFPDSAVWCVVVVVVVVVLKGRGAVARNGLGTAKLPLGGTRGAEGSEDRDDVELFGQVIGVTIASSADVVVDAQRSAAQDRCGIVYPLVVGEGRDAPR